jgi:hypothetical protein
LPALVSSESASYPKLTAADPDTVSLTTLKLVSYTHCTDQLGTDDAPDRYTSPSGRSPSHAYASVPPSGSVTDVSCPVASPNCLGDVVDRVN